MNAGPACIAPAAAVARSTLGRLSAGTGRAAIGTVSLAWIVLAAPRGILAATPSPSPAGGDTRSGGEGPGLVGEPVLALAVVALIALVAIVLSLAYVRFTAPADPPRRPSA